jgi:hypothetical protein
LKKILAMVIAGAFALALILSSARARLELQFYAYFDSVFTERHVFACILA